MACQWSLYDLNIFSLWVFLFIFKWVLWRDDALEKNFKMFGKRIEAVRMGFGGTISSIKRSTDLWNKIFKIEHLHPQVKGSNRKHIKNESLESGSNFDEIYFSLCCSKLSHLHYFHLWSHKIRCILSMITLCWLLYV